jgi:hypothetical protein
MSYVIVDLKESLKRRRASACCKIMKVDMLLFKLV